MTLTQLEHVLQAHKAGSFGKAARVCGISQSALSNSIAKLEEELGERVFSRTTRAVRLSPFGATLLPHIEQILAGRDDLLGAAQAQLAPAITSVGHSPLIPSDLLMQIVGTIRDARLGSEIRLVEDNLTDLLQRLVEHTLDIALVPEADYASALRSAPVYDDPLFYVPRRGAGPASPSVVLDSLADETFVMVPDRCGLARTTRTLFASVGMTLRAYAGEAMSYRVLEEWAALDLGAAILPQSRLSDRAAAVPLMLEPGVPAVLTYRAVWHGGYSRGKQLGVVLLPYQRELAARRGSTSSR